MLSLYKRKQSYALYVLGGSIFHFKKFICNTDNEK